MKKSEFIAHIFDARQNNARRNELRAQGLYMFFNKIGYELTKYAFAVFIPLKIVAAMSALKDLELNIGLSMPKML